MFGKLIEKLKASPKRIVFTEGTDPRILEASARLLSSNFLTPILVGSEAEVKAAAEEAGKRTGVILLTGGGIIKTAENYAALHQNGRIYQLVRDLSLLPTEGRPLSQGADLAAMWRERAPLYARFRDVEIDNSGTVEDTAAAIWRDFCAHSGS